MNRNKNHWFITALVGLLVITFGLLTLLKPSQLTQTQQSTSAQATRKAAEPITNPGLYIDYSDEALASTQGRRILFFYASWCPQCRALEKSIQGTGVPSGMAIFKVNYDTQTALRQQYDITLQTTIVEIDASGALLKKHVAYDDPSLPAVLKALE